MDSKPKAVPPTPALGLPELLVLDGAPEADLVGGDVPQPQLQPQPHVVGQTIGLGPTLPPRIGRMMGLQGWSLIIKLRKNWPRRTRLVSQDRAGLTAMVPDSGARPLVSVTVKVVKLAQQGQFIMGGVCCVTLNTSLNPSGPSQTEELRVQLNRQTAEPLMLMVHVTGPHRTVTVSPPPQPRPPKVHVPPSQTR